MIAVYVVAGLFLVWLVAVLFRVRQMAPAHRAAGRQRGGEVCDVAGAVAGAGCCSGGGASCVARPRSLAVLLQDQADGVEFLVNRLAANLCCCPGQRVALVDGGSADATGLILERLARRYNMEFYQLTGDEPVVVQESVRLLDLRGIPGQDLRRCDLSLDA
ncbi:hypothetical protein SPSYN_00841 [Sporotomaculum syntrophicum]|uniref:Uncharacterized protein n=1 Tax=Sporotomaculum syntrophicum TaxID=182264 RepID=A0A9D2WR46_9FIRM|nr:hypothetical protein [Sporotomaculum syntrophicum]KAF1086102.1 hypothetical protein SPSYN_00841 [Sporotomaculum syntrophicum]